MSEITRGVIGMPYEMAMESELSRRQFHAIARELYAENERLRADYAALSTFNPDWDRVAAAQDSVREHMELANQLKAECEGLRNDAERYRFVRSDLSSGKVDLCIVQKDWKGGDIQWLCMEQADYKIDVAMSKESGQ